MATDFQNLVMRIVAEEGIGIFDKLGQFKELLQKAANREFKREIRLFLISLQAGCYQELRKSADPEVTKLKLIQKLQDDYGITPGYAEETITVLGTVLKEGKKNTGERLAQLERAAKGGDYRSQYELGILLEQQKRYEASIHWLKQAARQGLILYELSVREVASKSFQKAESAKSSGSEDNFIRIKGGIFMMGSPRSEWDRDENEVMHPVKLNGFSLGKHLVTQQEYESVMGTNPSTFKGDTLPVECVSWYDTIEYCNKRSAQEGLIPVYTINKSRSDSNNTNEFDINKWLVNWNWNADGYRLPTEAEWEYACRAGTNTAFYTGNSITVAQANYDGKEQSRQSTTMVGSFAPNPWGLYDMHGNIFEWCWDWYGNYISGGTQTDPFGVTSGTHRVLRGGSWNKKAQTLRSAYRVGSTPSLRSSEFGFRLVRPQ